MGRVKRLRLEVAALVMSALAWALPAQAGLPVIKLNAGINVIRAEVANTRESRERGLMYRKSLGPNQGMLFVFRESKRYCMWMKNTLVPLSVAFLDEQGVVVSISDMAPRTEDVHCSNGPARFALEMSKGWFASKGIRVGGKIEGLQHAPTPR